MTYEEYCTFIRDNCTPLNPDLYTFSDDIFVPSLVRDVRAGSAEALRAIYREPHPQVYVFDMLRPEFCTALLEEAAAFEAWCVQNEVHQLRPNTMNNYGVVLDSIGFGPFLQELMTRYVHPFASRLYADAGGDSLDNHHGFIVEYEVGKDTSLDFHVDASDVTLNVCLGREFTGGALIFRGIRCAVCQQTEPRPPEEFEISHVPGRAILHRGKHRHGANPILGGQRSNLILWCNSSRFDRRHDRTRCAPWCGNAQAELSPA